MIVRKDGVFPNAAPIPAKCGGGVASELKLRVCFSAHACPLRLLEGPVLWRHLHLGTAQKLLDRKHLEAPVVRSPAGREITSWATKIDLWSETSDKG
jgi:hypothetical protein